MPLPKLVLSDRKATPSSILTRLPSSSTRPRSSDGPMRATILQLIVPTQEAKVSALILSSPFRTPSL